MHTPTPRAIAPAPSGCPSPQPRRDQPRIPLDPAWTSGRLAAPECHPAPVPAPPPPSVPTTPEDARSLALFPKSPPERREVRGAAPGALNPAEPPPAPQSLPRRWVRAQGVGSLVPPPLTSRRPSPQVLEAGATGGPAD
ncbi:PREDICTED: anther-specific proline-rich protein APG-like [Ceratotherium simum simum]|uniref:Anther-specific proline-rich protein APG-like n=1 Tax=Ceratotherium simum simum TaxID=73337 RepID=A0ABM1D128_CERSS|nr:PREDICTED: anther-specific proline-rich protein APG-like [Ceratotherium simum simum]